MHSPDKIQLFFDLRSRGNCLSYIARTIGVPTSTLSDWNRRYALDIDASRACKWEAAEQAVKFNTEADLVRVIQRIGAFERELDRRSPEHMSVGELVRVIALWRREYFRRRNGLLRSIECPNPIPEPESESEIPGKIPVLTAAGPSPVVQLVTPDVRSGLTNHDTSENTTTSSETAAHKLTDKPEPETKPEKTGIPESHSPTSPPAHPLAAHGESDSPALNAQLSTLNSSPPRLFSIEDHLPTSTDEWLPDDNQLLVYRPRQPAVSDNGVPQKTNIASPA